MLQVTTIVFFLLFITACKPFSNTEIENQFSQKKQQLLFDGHKLGYWLSKDVPKCKHCSFHIYTKKMPKGAMLFKEVNNERGDLIFLSATNLRHHFALQTGGYSYSIGIKLTGKTLLLSTTFSEEMALTINQPQTLQVGEQKYVVSLQKINAEKGAVDILFWLANPL